MQLSGITVDFKKLLIPLLYSGYLQNPILECIKMKLDLNH